MAVKILIADDEANIRQLLTDVLEVEIPDCHVIAAKDGTEAIDLFFSEPEISLCILDVMMPGSDGYEVLEVIREHSNVPIIILTALGASVNELKGFQKGVSDYIAKPFSLPILLARLQRLLKEERKLFLHGDLTVDFDGHNVYVKETEIPLTPREFSLFAQLINNQGLVLTREQLLGKAWGYDYEGDERTVDTHIKTLRKKLGDYGRTISTIRGTGYKFQVNP